MKRTPTPAQREATEAKRAKFRALAKRIADMSPEARAAFAFSCPVVTTIEGRTLSPCNTMLAASQCPTATIVGGFRQWIRAGRCVRKGEHGLSIWVPKFTGNGIDHTPETSGDAPTDPETAHRAFLIGTVFDVSQTDELKPEQPIATISPEIAAAFGMTNLPNVRVMDPESEMVIA